MNVETTHPAYMESLPLWSLTEDVINGQMAVKNKGEVYLPKPSGMDDQAYKSYLARAVFTMFTARACEQLYGQIFSKLPEKQGEIPPAFQDFLANVDKSGTSVDQFASDIVWATLQKPWGGILADHSPVPPGLSQAEKEKLGLTSFLRWYSAESLDNWRYDTINDRSILVMVKLKEVYQQIVDDEFNPKTKTRYRVLKLVDGQTLENPREGMVYIQQVWEKATDKEEWIITGTFIPELDGKPLDFIPFFTCPAKEPEKSMLLPSAYLNIGHYQMTADYNWNLHLTGTPTPVGVNIEAKINEKTGKPEPVGLGGSQMQLLNNFGDREPKVFFLEPAGTGANNILHGLEGYEKNLEIMGGSPIKKSKAGVETAEAARIHQAGENSVLGSFSLNMSEVLTQVIRCAARWRGIPEAVTKLFNYLLNQDYENDQNNIEARKMGISLVDAGLMSKDRFLTEIEAMDENEAKEEIALINGEGTLQPSNTETIIE